jgi:hypothetical protein
MQRIQPPFNRTGLHPKPDRAKRPELEGLENRLLLYAALGDQWTYSNRITYSLMPDGTNIGGTPSALFQTLNANIPTATWQQQIAQAASLWEDAANVNLSLVSDDGLPEGTSGDQQGDSRFGDIRIGAIPLPSGVLAETFLPPPANGGTDAGDIVLNSTVNWQVNSNYDLMTVVAHEFGHALGLGESTVPSAVMYGTYNGIKQALASDDIAGIQSIYGAPQFDQFNTGGKRDNTYFTATSINSFIGSNAQLVIPSLDITTAGDSEWFYLNVPASTNGTMTITVQSTNLSLLSPKLQVYNSALALVGQASAVGSTGATISVGAGVQAGQGYYIKVFAAGGPAPIGAYGLLVNFGSQPQSPIPPPYTVVAQEPDRGGGTSDDLAPPGGAQSLSGLTSIGSLSGWCETFMNPPNIDVAGQAPGGTSEPGAQDTFWIGDVSITVMPNSSQNSQGLVLWSLSTTNSADQGSLPIATGPAPSILQALDEALEQLTSDLMGFSFQIGNA